MISVGHYMERKGILDFIALARSMPQVQFFWFGYTPPSLVPRRVRKAMAQAPANLHFPGFVSQEGLREAYCGADAFVFCSHEETEGIVVLEALACGVPVLLRDIPVYRGWLEDGVNVYKAAGTAELRLRLAALLAGRLPDVTAAGRAVAEARAAGDRAGTAPPLCGAAAAPPPERRPARPPHGLTRGPWGRSQFFQKIGTECSKVFCAPHTTSPYTGSCNQTKKTNAGDTRTPSPLCSGPCEGNRPARGQATNKASRHNIQRPVLPCRTGRIGFYRRGARRRDPPEGHKNFCTQAPTTRQLQIAVLYLWAGRDEDAENSDRRG